MRKKTFALALLLTILSSYANAEGGIALEVGLLNSVGISIPTTRQTELRLGTGNVYFAEGYSGDLRFFKETGHAGRYWFVSAYRLGNLLGLGSAPVTLVMTGPGKIWRPGHRFQWGAEIGPSYTIEEASIGFGVNGYLRYSFR